jgi:hypothetical protein
MRKSSVITRWPLWKYCSKQINIKKLILKEKKIAGIDYHFNSMQLRLVTKDFRGFATVYNR